MRSSQVYQPTTTTLTFDRNKTWMSSFLSEGQSGSVWSRTLVLVIAVFFIVLGLVMIIVGATYQEPDSTIPGNKNNRTSYIIILCVGILFEVAAVTAMIIYYRSLGYHIPCCPGKIVRIRKRLNENQIAGNGLMSSGEPVSAQYCPPAPPSLSSSPPLPYTDVSEEQHLMEEKQDVGEMIFK